MAVKTSASACAAPSSAWSWVRSASSSDGKSLKPSRCLARAMPAALAPHVLVGQLHEPLLLLPVGDERRVGLFQGKQDRLVAFGPGPRASWPARRAKTEPARSRDRTHSTGGWRPPTLASRWCRRDYTRPARSPRTPEIVIRGYRSAAATPSPAAADASRRSAARTSGRRSRSRSGGPSEIVLARIG